ncbi:hypothetical protein [Bacillus toyonensis]|uniref:hypothetical protein n=1 Tax=Bacillus toyonensis TaxID=155322 RepID=UPI000BFA3D18|nr:hypothetical protein [Bacillus toyonensis]PGF05335.1 hypothetical protein COM61_02685 [Bacillus toyonensis]
MANKEVVSQDELNLFLDRDKPHYGIVIMEGTGENKGKVYHIEVYDTSRSNIVVEFAKENDSQPLTELLQWLTNKGLQLTEKSSAWVDTETGFLYRYYIILK